MDKAPDAYRTISEVAEDLDLPQHVLRFWETRFGQIKPLKRGGGRRYYRPDDVELLKGIRHLLYKEGYTIKGVQRILKEQGVRAVQSVARPPEPSDWEIPEAPLESVPRAVEAAPVPAHVTHRFEASSGPAPGFVEPAPTAAGSVMRPPQGAFVPAAAPAYSEEPPPPEPARPEPSWLAPAPPEGEPYGVGQPAPVVIEEPVSIPLPEAPPPIVARPQVSMFRGGLTAGAVPAEAASGEAEADFVAELREKLERARTATPQYPPPPPFQPLPMPDQGQRQALGAALEELLTCKALLERLLQKRTATA